MIFATLVLKFCGYCEVFRDDGMSYDDYVEQLTDLLFLKMADERSCPPYNQARLITMQYAWHSLLAKDGEEQFDRDRHAPLTPTCQMFSKRLHLLPN